MTSDNKETFESELKLIKEKYKENADLRFDKLKQLHDQSIQDEIEKAFKDDELINNWINEKIKEKDKQILELKKEIERLKLVCKNHWDFGQDQITLVNKKREEINKLQSFKEKSERLEEELQRQFNLVKTLQNKLNVFEKFPNYEEKIKKLQAENEKLKGKICNKLSFCRFKGSD